METNKYGNEGKKKLNTGRENQNQQENRISK